MRLPAKTRARNAAHRKMSFLFGYPALKTVAFVAVPSVVSEYFGILRNNFASKLVLTSLSDAGCVEFVANTNLRETVFPRYFLMEITDDRDCGNTYVEATLFSFVSHSHLQHPISLFQLLAYLKIKGLDYISFYEKGSTRFRFLLCTLDVRPVDRECEDCYELSSYIY